MDRTKPIKLATVALAIMAGLASQGGCGREDDADPAVDTPAAEADDQYKPEVDEGLGASVAILVDNSGSMEDRAKGDAKRKFVVAREALATVLAATDSFVAAQPDFPINVGLYTFSSRVQTRVPVQRYNRETLRSAIESLPEPDGGTAIGDAMAAARADLYRAGTFRKYILVVTDGENTNGRSPESVAREIARRSEGAVRMYFIAFDIDAGHFDFLREVRGEVMGAGNGLALKASLDTIYRGKILAEALDAGETLPDSTRRVIPDTTRSPASSKERLQ
ncbi:MAG: vWA domain-containing protein [Gemmatimonadota bacterium]